MTLTCDYAACSKRATKKLAEWVFCLDHSRAHLSEHVGADAPPPAKVLQPVYCGTMPGYREHLADGVEPCSRCVKANNNATRQKRKRQKRAAAKDSALSVDVCRVDGELGTACWAGGEGEAPNAQQATPRVAA